MVVLPTENGDFDGNAKDPYVNEVGHDDDNCKNDPVTAFRRENINSAYSRSETYLTSYLIAMHSSSPLIRLLTYRLSRRLEGPQPFMLLLDW